MKAPGAGAPYVAGAHPGCVGKSEPQAVPEALRKAKKGGGGCYLRAEDLP